MGRKASFDREEALKGALKCFWIDGYDKTSLEDLLKAMEIQTSSFYNSFKSKEDLFVEAVQWYRREVGAKRLELLRDEEQTAREQLYAYFEKMVTKTEFPPGCFMMKTAATLVDPNSTVAKEVETAISNLEKAFTKTLEQGREKKEFTRNWETKTVARLLVTQAYGLSVLVRTKKTKKELLETAESLIAAL